MSNDLDRRKASDTEVAAMSAAGNDSPATDDAKRQEFYELRIYKTADFGKMQMLERYLQYAMIPALGRQGLDRIGVFKNMDEPDDDCIYVLIPYPTLDIFAGVNARLLADPEYIRASKDHFAAPQDAPVFTRIKSRLYKAFLGMPVIEMPRQTATGEARVFELRMYESHTEEKASLKVDMFNSEEIQLMRDTGLAPVFYGEALIGDDLPHLAYMLSASDRETHDAHWATFGANPDWQTLRAAPKYENTVSKITNYFLKPTPYSGI